MPPDGNQNHAKTSNISFVRLQGAQAKFRHRERLEGGEEPEKGLQGV